MTRITDERAAHFDFVISQTGHLGALEARELLSDRSDSAAEIERLRAELTEWQESHRNHARSLELRTQMWKSAEALLAECKAALEPFAKELEADATLHDDQIIECQTRNEVRRLELRVKDFRAARTLLSRLSAVPAPGQTKALVEALDRLIKAAMLLWLNSAACANSHHNIDLEQQGIPGWLADCQKDIRNARAALDAYRKNTP